MGTATLAYGTGRNEVAARLLAETDDCVEWPFAKNTGGYGRVWIDGKVHHTHAIACNFAHGPAPSPLHEVAHTCGNAKCMNHRHLRWATHAENLADTVTHGTSTSGERNPGSKLTEAQVRTIRARRAGGEAVSTLAHEYGVLPHAISALVNRRTWRHIT